MLITSSPQGTIPYINLIYIKYVNYIQCVCLTIRLHPQDIRAELMMMMEAKSEPSKKIAKNYGIPDLMMGNFSSLLGFKLAQGD